MQKQQLQALIDYHKKAEKAYRGIGDLQKQNGQSRQENGLRKNKTKLRQRKWRRAVCALMC